MLSSSDIIKTSAFIHKAAQGANTDCKRDSSQVN